MIKILEAFADDNLCINPTNYKGSPEYRKAFKLMCKSAEELENKLNDEEKKLFEQFRDAQADESCIYNVDRFVRGYRVGVLIMFEVFAGTAGLIYGEKGEIE